MTNARLMNLASLAISACAIVSVGACVTEAPRSALIHEVNEREPGSSAQTMVLAADPNAIYLVPGESVTIPISRPGGPDYRCTTGRPLTCDGYGRMRYCTCPYGR
jgi:hypothetical protein